MDYIEFIECRSFEEGVIQTWVEGESKGAGHWDKMDVIFYGIDSSREVRRINACRSLGFRCREDTEVNGWHDVKEVTEEIIFTDLKCWWSGNEFFDTADDALVTIRGYVRPWRYYWKKNLLLATSLDFLLLVHIIAEISEFPMICSLLNGVEVM